MICIYIYNDKIHIKLPDKIAKKIPRIRPVSAWEMESKMAGLAQAPEPSEKLLGVEVRPMFVKNVGFYSQTLGNWGFQILFFNPLALAFQGFPGICSGKPSGPEKRGIRGSRHQSLDRTCGKLSNTIQICTWVLCAGCGTIVYTVCT